MAKTLYLERSTADGRRGDWVDSIDLNDVGRIVVGMGPGSFAGIRAALAFARGYAIGSGCEVLGLPSPCAIAAQWFDKTGNGDETHRSRELAVVGDARRGKIWIALFEGYRLVRDVCQVSASELAAAIPANCPILTADAERLDSLLAETFGPRYCGGDKPTPDGLARFTEECPSALVAEPRPIYLNPAVRSI